MPNQRARLEFHLFGAEKRAFAKAAKRSRMKLVEWIREAGLRVLRDGGVLERPFVGKPLWEPKSRLRVARNKRVECGFTFLAVLSPQEKVILKRLCKQLRVTKAGFVRAAIRVAGCRPLFVSTISQDLVENGVICVPGGKIEVVDGVET